MALIELVDVTKSYRRDAIEIPVLVDVTISVDAGDFLGLMGPSGSGKPTLLLADEPTGDLDAKSAAEVLTLLQRLNHEFKKTIVMVTHDPHAAERAAHLLHLEKGTLVEQAKA